METTYGNWTIISYKGNKNNYLVCKCICGIIREVKKYDIYDGSSKSCGSIGCRGKLQKQGFDSTSRKYSIWKSMIRRCSDSTSNSYKYYGGRGITYDPRWENFSEFWKDMKYGYKDHLTLERIDNNKSYCKENCRWATKKEQANNRRSNHLLEFNGKTQNMKQWADELGIKWHSLWQRLDRNNWDLKKCLSFKNTKIK